MSHVKIQKTSLGIRLPVDKTGKVIGTHVDIQYFTNRFVSYEFDTRRKRMIAGRRYRWYDKGTGMLYMSAAYLDELKDFLYAANVNYAVVDLEPPAGADIEIEMKEGFTPKDERQEKAIAHLTENKDPVKGISLQTGVGKTVTFLAKMAHNKKRAMISCDGLLDQWVAAALEWTSLEEDDIYLVQGASSLSKLIRQIDKTIDPKFIVCSIPTLRSYSQNGDAYERFPAFDDLCQHLDVGLRCVDEGHLNFHANFVIDTRLNVKETVVLTATFDVTDQTAKSIFDRHYPPTMRFGEGTYKKYVNVTAVLHRSSRSKMPPRAWKTPKGYSHVRLEKWIMHPSRKALLAEFLDRTMRLIGFYYTRIRASDQRCLVFCSTVEMCKKVVSHIRKQAPEYVTNVYVAESPEEVLTESDIIVSTLKSAGTGKDIPKLRTVIQTVAVGSTPQNIQNLGRPRELRGYPEEHSTPEFVYTADEAIPKQMDYHRHRSFIFGARAKAFRTISI